MHLNVDTPCGLQNKVQFDIPLYFCRRDSENMHAMTKTTFIVKTYVNAVCLMQFKKLMTDELTKNHRENDREATSEFMLEISGSS